MEKKCDYAVSAEWPILLNSSLDEKLATPRHGMNDHHATWNMRDEIPRPPSPYRSARLREINPIEK